MVVVKDYQKFQNLKEKKKKKKNIIIIIKVIYKLYFGKFPYSGES